MNKIKNVTELRTAVLEEKKERGLPDTQTTTNKIINEVVDGDGDPTKLSDRMKTIRQYILNTP